MVSAKHRGSQWYVLSALCAHTGRVKVKCGLSGRSYGCPSIHIYPLGAGYCTEWVVNGLKKSTKNRGEDNGMPSLPTGQKMGNVGSVDEFWAAHLSRFGLGGRVMHSQNPQKLGEANGMPNLPTGPTQVTKTGNVGSVDVFWYGSSIHIWS